MKVGILHPGAMGSLVAATCGADTYWASEGRSAATGRRAEERGIVDLGDLAALVAAVDVVVAVCPPAAALDVADAVARAGFGGIYVDANAIAPETARQVGERFDRSVDGGIIGPPPATQGTTRLYLSGGEADTVASLWAGSSLEPRVIAGPPGAASALKMAYAGWTKGSTALLLAMRAYAAAAGVDEALLEEWRLSIPELPDRVEQTGARIGKKAWRFEGEMEQIASALEGAGLPSGFHDAATEVYRRLSGLKGVDETSIDDVIALLRGDG